MNQQTEAIAPSPSIPDVEPIERSYLQNTHPSTFPGVHVDGWLFNVPKNRNNFLPSPVQINECLSCLIEKISENCPKV
jgi:hypothetical protein